MSGKYQVVWPSGRRISDGTTLAKRLDSLEACASPRSWDDLFKGDKMFESWRRQLTERYPTIEFVDWRRFGNIHGPLERQLIAELPQKLAGRRLTPVICGVGC